MPAVRKRLNKCLIQNCMPDIRQSLINLSMQKIMSVTKQRINKCLIQNCMPVIRQMFNKYLTQNCMINQKYCLTQNNDNK